MAGTRERSLEMTSTWAVAVICFVLVAISIFLEYVLHLVGTWFKKKRKRALYEALEKIKAELMLLGFFSLMLSILQTYIARICIPRSVGHSWHPCPRDEESDDSEYNDPCLAQGRVQLVSAYGLNQLHKFVFALAVSHVIYSIITLGLGTLKMRKWKTWEDETKTIEYQYYNDPERFRFARETSFGRRHMSFWSKSPVLLWIVCFFRQFFGSVAKVDYLTLRHGFMIAHLAPQSQESFDFQKYIQRSLEEDFKHVVEITPIIWMFAVLFLLPNTNGWYSYFWLPFIPLVVLLVVGTKLQMIITKMGLRIQARGDVIKGTPVVEPGDHLFWFNRPRLLLFLINFVLFQNAFQLAFFAWSWYSFGIPSCFHRRPEDIAIRISMGVIIQVLCSYVTLPQYALVTQMGSNMKPAIFNDRVATALKSWYHSAKKNNKGGRRSENTTPFSSRPATPLHGTSPLHLLHNYPHYAADDSLQASPRASNYDNEGWGAAEGSVTSTHNNDNESTRRGKRSAEQGIQDPTTSRTSPAPGQMHQISEHEVGISLRDFSFIERG